MKICNVCKKKLPLSAFHKRSQNKGGVRYSCIDCVKKESKKTCPDCKIMHYGENRKTTRCKKCYPLYKKSIQLYGSIKVRSKKNNLEFDLTKDWLLNRILNPCPMTGITYVLSKGLGSNVRLPYAPSIDRIDPSRGYTKENCRMVCWWYNITKYTYTDEEVLELCRKVIKTANQ